jgi:hypothetical protein
MSNQDFYDLPIETIEKMRIAKLGNKNGWKLELDAKYAEARLLVEKSVSVTCACEAVGLSRDQYYRRLRIETTGRDRSA